MSEISIETPAYPCAPPGIARGVEILPGLFWVRLPLPFELNHINVWLIRETDGWTLIDTGLDIPPVRKAWRVLRRTLLDDLPIQRIIVTHLHPDHIGLAEYLREIFDANVCMTAPTMHQAQLLWQGPEQEEESGIREFCHTHGIDRIDDYTDFTTGKGYRRIISGVPAETEIITEESVLQIGDHAWIPVISYGHAPGHLSLYCEELGVLISGDHILPTITCNISVFATNYPEDALGVYLESMHRFEQLPEDTLILPSHGQIFTGLHDRIGFISTHHRQTLDRILSLCEEPLSLGQVAPKLFRRSLEGANYSLAMGEAMAHLVYLYNRNEIMMHEEGGVRYFRRK